MSEKRTKFDKSQRNVERLAKHDEAYPETSEITEKGSEPDATISLEEQIRERAYELYEARGRKGGDELKDWLQAEAEIRRRATGISNVVPFRPVPK